MGKGTLVERMGIELTEAGTERVVATMPVEGNTQPYGLLHGGASVVLAETLGSIGSALHAGPDRIAVGIDINATHHRAARSGLVTGIATPLHLGSTMASWQVAGRRRGGPAGVHLAAHLPAARRGPGRRPRHPGRPVTSRRSVADAGDRGPHPAQRPPAGQQVVGDRASPTARAAGAGR